MKREKRLQMKKRDLTTPNNLYIVKTVLTRGPLNTKYGEGESI